MAPPFEVDADYHWATEVLACAYLDDRDDPPEEDIDDAVRIVNRAGLFEPMPRLE